MNANFDQIINEANNYSVYFRAHNEAGISLEAMQGFKSYHGQDENGDDIFLDAVCASDCLGERNFGGASAVAEEIVAFRGQRLSNVYDGVVVYPTEIVHRFAIDEYDAFCDYVDSL